MAFAAEAEGGGPQDLLVNVGDLRRADDEAVRRFPQYFLPHPASDGEVALRQRELMAQARAA
jgi:hypothetical protein